MSGGIKTYEILNKDTVIGAVRCTSNNHKEDWEVQWINKPWFIRCSVEEFLESRRCGMDREIIYKLVNVLGISKLSDFLDATHGLSLTDCLWVREFHSTLTWGEVNLYDNEFDETVSEIALIDKLRGKPPRLLSPEWSTDGSFSKCWKNVYDLCFLAKGGTKGFSNTGLEPYSEQYASDIAEALGLNHILYTVNKVYNTPCSLCRRITNKNVSLLGLDKFITNRQVYVKHLLNFGEEYDCINEIKDMLVFDSLILNTDRHLGNIGVLVDSNSYKFLGLAPIFDNNISLLCYKTIRDLDDLEVCMHGLTPSLYADFDQGLSELLTLRMQKALIKFKDYKLERCHKYDLPQARLDKLNKMLQLRRQRILSLGTATKETSAFG